MATGTRQEPIVLDFAEKGKQVLVKPQNQDLFLVSVQDAAAACQMADKVCAFADQFKALLDKLAGWIKANRESISKAFVTIRDAGFLFLVVQSSPCLDRPLESALTALDLEVAQDRSFDLLRLNVLALPASSSQAYGSFLDANQTWTFKNA